MALEFSFSDISKFFDNTKKDENSVYLESKIVRNYFYDF